MIDSQRGAQHQVGYNYLICNKREWESCFIKNNDKKLLNTADLVIFSFLPEAYPYHICGACYKGSYTMALNQPIRWNCVI